MCRAGANLLSTIIKSCARNKQQFFESAYFTVEAALILPTVMLFTVMMIFLAFYSYDRCVMEHCAYEAALRGTGSQISSATEAEKIVSTAAERLIEERLFALRDFSYEVSVDAKQVTVTYYSEINMPFMTWLGEYMPNINMTFNVSRSAKRLNPTRTIRSFMLISLQNYQCKGDLA